MEILSQRMHARKNNLDIIRFIAATLVIVSHSYPLSVGNNDLEPLSLITNNQMTFGSFAVAIFFIISGFLITQSFEKSSTLTQYLKSRILRIFPALIGVVLFSIFILGPIATSLSISDYFSNISTYKYLLTISLLPLSPSLPGVFADNIFTTAINGSLWTLKFEFFFYIVVAILGVFKLLTKRVVLPAFIVMLIGSEFITNDNLHHLFILGAYFFAGILIYLYRDKFKLSSKYAIISLLLLLLTSQVGLFDMTFAIFGSYLVFYLGYTKNAKFSNFTKYGDFSYGIYIYAFPIQQLVTQIFGGEMVPFINFLISFVITLIFAVLSWWFIEKPSLKMKKYSLLYSVKKKSLSA